MQRRDRDRRMGRDVGIDEHSAPVVAVDVFPAEADALRLRAEVDQRQGGGESGRGTAARRWQRDGQGGFVLAGGHGVRGAAGDAVVGADAVAGVELGHGSGAVCRQCRIVSDGAPDLAALYGLAGGRQPAGSGSRPLRSIRRIS